jgi:hypothetical protein
MTKPKRFTPEEAAAAKESANLKRRVRRLWSGDLTLGEICEELSLGEREFLALASSLGLHDRPEPDVYLPTPEQIRLAAAEIRADWTRAELESRRVPLLRGRLE